MCTSQMYRYMKTLNIGKDAVAATSLIGVIGVKDVKKLISVTTMSVFKIYLEIPILYFSAALSRERDELIALLSIHERSKYESVNHTSSADSDPFDEFTSFEVMLHFAFLSNVELFKMFLKEKCF